MTKKIVKVTIEDIKQGNKVAAAFYHSLSEVDSKWLLSCSGKEFTNFINDKIKAGYEVRV